MRSTATTARRLGLSVGLGAAALALGCRADPPSSDTGTTDPTDDAGVDEGSDDGSEPPKEQATITHGFPTYTLAPREELLTCLQWTPGNAWPLYAQAVTLANDGGIHHSNWFILPEDQYPGPDGYFDCESRMFTEFDAAFAGTVLAAQSTQARYERMALPEGVVVKIPPAHKIVAGVHLLNLADAELDTDLRLSLDLVHPRDVEVVATPFRLSYYDLELPAFTEVRHSATCNFAAPYENATGGSFDLQLYWLLPHYHQLGNYFDLSIVGGPRDGQSVFRLDGFDADANGQAYPEPIDLRGADGLRFTCGYDNWTDRTVGWGIGGNEMCAMLGLADSELLLDGSVLVGSAHVAGTEGAILLREGSCGVVGIPKRPEQGMPDPIELQRSLYVPPVDPSDADLPPVDECADVPASAMPEGAVTLSRVRDTLFVSTCQFSSCHEGDGAAAGLDLAADDLHAELLEHQVLADTDLPLIAPGDPEGSWLYRRVAECTPTDRHGDAVPHMPLNAPRLAEPTMVAGLRAWIQAGAHDD